MPKFQIQFQSAGKWVRSESNPFNRDGFDARSDAAIVIAWRLRDSDCNLGFRIVEVEEANG
jgi:hypothetical protein